VSGVPSRWQSEDDSVRRWCVRQTLPSRPGQSTSRFDKGRATCPASTP
jgi:hypothetical protein